MEGGDQGHAQPPKLQQQQPPAPPPAVEALDASLREQLNLDDLKIRAIGLSENISRLIGEIKVHPRTKTDPKWQDFLSQYSMVMFELNNFVNEIEKVSNAFVVHPHNVNSENSTILPVTLATRKLPEIEMDDKSKKEELPNESQDLTTAQLIEKLKGKVDVISAAYEAAESELSVVRGAYGFGNHQGPATTQTQEQAQAAKIQEQEKLLRAAVNHGEGLRASADQSEITPTLPKHLIDVLNVCVDTENLDETHEMSPTSDPVQFQSNTISGSSMLLQATGQQLTGPSAASPSAATSFDITKESPLPFSKSPGSAKRKNASSPEKQSNKRHHSTQQQFRQLGMPGLEQAAQPQFIGLAAAASVDTTTASPQPYANLPWSGTSMNAPSPQQQPQQQLLHPHHHQSWLQPQFRQSAIPALGQFSQQPGSHRQFQGRQVTSVDGVWSGFRRRGHILRRNQRGLEKSFGILRGQIGEASRDSAAPRS